MIRILPLISLLALLAFFQGGQAGSDWGCNPNVGNHSTSWGSRTYGDKMVFMDNPRLEAKWLRKQSIDVVYPPPGAGPGQIITMIQVIDNQKDGSGGCAYLTKGGVGTRSASLHFKTQRGQGLNMRVLIYAV